VILAGNVGDVVPWDNIRVTRAGQNDAARDRCLPLVQFFWAWSGVAARATGRRIAAPEREQAAPEVEHSYASPTGGEW